jgi:outer membrane receptor protein involved in Fe transport
MEICFYNFRLVKFIVRTLSMWNVTNMRNCTPKVFLACVQLFIPLFTLSQGLHSITGKVWQQDQVLTGATIFLFRDSVIVRTAITNKEGGFILSNIDSGQYIISITHTGLQPYNMPVMLSGPGAVKDLGSIALQKSAVTLQQVIVEAKRPVIEYKTDRVIFNVPEKLQHVSRNSFDLMNKAPGVVVDRDGKLQIDGQSNVLVMVNGRQRFSSKEEAIEFLKNIPADQVLSIEVVQNPSAKYDQSAAGGILNIVLKRDETQGLQGSYNGYFNAGTYNRYGSGLNLNFRKKKVNIYTLYNYNHDLQYETGTASQQAALGSSTYSLDQQYNLLRKPNYHNLRTGIDFNINKRNVIGALVNLTFNNQNISRNTSSYYRPAHGSLDSLITLGESRESDYQKLFFNLNYNSVLNAAGNQTLNVDISVLQDDLRNESDFLHQYFNGDLVKSRSDFKLHNNIPSLVDLRVARVEYAQVLGKDINMEAGIKSSHSKTDNNVQYDTVVNGLFLEDVYRTRHYVYEEDVHAVYASFSRFTKKYAWTIGGRFESASVNGQTFGHAGVSRKFDGFFPNATFRYTINPSNRLSLSLRKSVVRPDFIKLNPFIQYVTQNFYIQGNPDLQQFNIYVASLRYTYKKYSLTIRYDYTSNYIPQELFVREGTSLVSKATYANAADLSGFQFTLYVPIEKFKWWSSYNNINVFHSTVRSRDAKYTGLDFTNTNANLYSSNVFTLPWKLYGEVNVSLGTNSRNNQTLFKGSYGIDVRLTQSVLQNRLKLTVLFEDITYQYLTKGFSNYNGIISSFSSQKDTRRFGVAASFQFGRKKVADRRQRSMGTEDEENRIKKI